MRTIRLLVLRLERRHIDTVLVLHKVGATKPVDRQRGRVPGGEARRHRRQELILAVARLADTKEGNRRCYTSSRQRKVVEPLSIAVCVFIIIIIFLFTANNRVALRHQRGQSEGLHKQQAENSVIIPSTN